MSIFTHDMRRYRRSFYKRMGDFTTLIIGPTGSGKELVARAVGLSRYIRFNPKSLTFEKDFSETFFPINLSALPLTLVESELFGHRRGAFTGALEDRKGWLEICPPEGSVFLDEIGELKQCVRNVMVRREYYPAGNLVSGIDERLPVGFQDGSLSLEEICSLYCTHVYSRAGSFLETARRLKIDRRTVKKYVDMV